MLAASEPTHLQEVPPFMHFLDIFISKDAAGPLELTRALSGSSRDNWLMHTMGSQEEEDKQKHRQEINSLLNKGCAIFNI